MLDDAVTARPESVTDGLSAWRIAIGSTLLVSFGMGVEYMLWANLRTIADDMSWPRWIPSAAYALEMVGTGIGGILMGRLADKIGTVPVVLIGAMMIPSGALAASHVTEAWQFCLVFGVMIGFLGNATLFAPLMANATRWFNRRMGLAVAIVASGQGIAGAIWPQIFEQMTAMLGWRQTLMLYGIFAMVVMPPMLLLLRGKPPGWDAMGAARKAQRDGGGRFGSLAENLPQIMLCLAIFCCCVAMAMPLLHIAAHTQDIGYASHDGAILLSVIMAISFVGRLGVGALADIIGGFRAMIIASGLQAAGLLFFFPFDGIVPLYIGAVMFGLGFGGLVPIYAVVLRAIYPAHTMGWRVGAILLFGAVGMAVGGQAAGALFDWMGTYRVAFGIGFAFNLANLALVFSVWRLTGGGHRLIAATAGAE